MNSQIDAWMAEARGGNQRRIRRAGSQAYYEELTQYREELAAEEAPAESGEPSATDTPAPESTPAA